MIRDSFVNNWEQNTPYFFCKTIEQMYSMRRIKNKIK